MDRKDEPSDVFVCAVCYVAFWLAFFVVEHVLPRALFGGIGVFYTISLFARAIAIDRGTWRKDDKDTS